VSVEKILDEAPSAISTDEGLSLARAKALQDETELLEVFKAVSTVFPDDPAPNDALEQYCRMRRALDESDTELERSGAFTGTNSNRERQRIYRRALKLFDADIRLSRKEKRARMALSHDWSEMAQYVQESIAIWKCRMMLRSGALFLRMGLPTVKEVFETVAYQDSFAPRSAPSVIPRPKLVGHSDARYSLERRGVSVTAETPRTVIRTGSITLDGALRIGGWPRGRIVEIFGRHSVGKTTLALAAGANVQRGGEKLAYFDNEYKLDFPWARTLGLNVEETLILGGTRAKDTLDSLLDIVRSGDFALVVVDSLAAFVPGEDVEMHEEQFKGELELLFARVLPRIASAAHKTGTCVLLLNQIRRDYEVMFGKPTVSTGGHAVHHYSSVRVELTITYADKRENDLVIGSRTKGTVVKNCVGSPFRTAEWAINFERGLDVSFELIEQGLARGVIDRRTIALKFRDEDLGRSKEAAREFLVEHPAVAAALETELRARINRGGGVTIPIAGADDGIGGRIQHVVGGN
jgi:recombination protein RecA